ncbi:MAG: flagellar basal body P-ring formation chaperone FlgA [Planctomycetaceae bacterium]|jgi:flagella basal body P-ring formation protein FlgA|nr:flagellar basal body P-ring formation chaperone FlgA [Planctomycetaceae bacterium]
MKNNSPFSIINYQFRTALMLLVIAALSAAANAAEIRFKSAPVIPNGSLVVLGDVADIIVTATAETQTSAEELKQTILFPAPPEGTERIISRQELHSMLLQLGISSVHHRITGSGKVTVTSKSGTASAVPAKKQFVIQQANYIETNVQHNVIPAVYSEAEPKIEGNFMKMLEKQVAEALNIYLNFTNKIDKSWEISLKLTPDQVKVLASNGQIKEITGGCIPFLGIQQFTLKMQTNVTVSVEAEIRLPMEIVVVRRPLPRGHIVTENDLMMKKVDTAMFSNGRGDDFIIDINEAAGKETLKAVMELNPLTKSVLQLPVLIRKGEIITVRAVNHGIIVRTEATALQDGVLGDTITVEKIDAAPKALIPRSKNKKGRDEAVTYLVRVCAPKTGEVYVN